MVWFDVAWLIRYFTRMQIKAPIGITLVSEPTASSLVLGDETGFLIFLGMSFTTTAILKGTFPCQKGQTNFIPLDNSFVTVNAIGSRTPGTVFA